MIGQQVAMDESEQRALRFLGFADDVACEGAAEPGCPLLVEGGADASLEGVHAREGPAGGTKPGEGLKGRLCIARNGGQCFWWLGCGEARDFCGRLHGK